MKVPFEPEKNVFPVAIDCMSLQPVLDCAESVMFFLSDFSGSWISSLFINVVFEKRVSYSPGCTQTHCEAKEGPELLTPLLLLPNCCYYIYVRPSPAHLFTVNLCFFVGEVCFLMFLFMHLGH